jgi:transcriptional regulator GlxA family with amidase domain
MRFRAAAGRTVGEEIVDQRIRRAKTLLAQRTMSQAQIAAVCGFTDASHMNVVFRRRCGVRPSEFRMGR